MRGIAESGGRVSDYYRELGRAGGYATAKKRLGQMTREDLENALRQVRSTKDKWQRWYWRRRVEVISAQIGIQL